MLRHWSPCRAPPTGSPPATAPTHPCAGSWNRCERRHRSDGSSRRGFFSWLISPHWITDQNLQIADPRLHTYRAGSGDVLQVGLGDAGAETVRETIAIIGVEGSILIQGQDGAATAAVQGVTATPADRIAGHRAVAPDLGLFLAQLDLALGRHAADADFGIARPLPAGIDVGEGIEDIHAVVGAAEARPQAGDDLPAVGEDAPHLGPHPLVRPGEDPQVRVVFAHPGQLAVELPGAEGRSGVGLAVAGPHGRGVGAESRR